MATIIAGRFENQQRADELTRAFTDAGIEQHRMAVFFVALAGSTMFCLSVATRKPPPGPRRQAKVPGWGQVLAPLPVPPSVPWPGLSAPESVPG